MPLFIQFARLITYYFLFVQLINSLFCSLCALSRVAETLSHLQQKQLTEFLKLNPLFSFSILFHLVLTLTSAPVQLECEEEAIVLDTNIKLHFIVASSLLFQLEM